MTVGSLFSGIGGFDLGLERAGMTIKWQVEIDDFCNKVLEKHWPDVKRYRDIKAIGGEELEPVDVICGGFPCQPFSAAGKRRSKEDDRYLWPEMLRIIRAVRPNWIIGENVAGIVNLALDDVLSDLENEGYSCQSFIIPACAVNAPHRRDRVWIAARARQQPEGDESRRLSGEQQHSGETKQRPEEGNRPSNGNQDATNADNSRSRTSRDGINREWQEKDKGQEGFAQYESSGYNKATSNSESKSGESDVQRCNRSAEQEQLGENTIKSIVDRGSDVPTDSERWGIPWLPIAASLCRVDDGLPRRMDRAKRLKALGNAVVPQIVEIIGRAIIQIEQAGV